MQRIHFQITDADVNYLPLLKPILSGKCSLSINSTTPTAITEVVMRAREKGTKQIATTSPKLLQLLLKRSGEKLPSVDEYAGSIIEAFGMEFLIVDPVEHLITVPYGKHLYERFFSKFLQPTAWLSIPEFSWQLFEPSQAETLQRLFSTAAFISADIETTRVELPTDERTITCIGFTAVHFNIASKSYTATTVVVPFTDTYHLAFARTILRLPVFKVFQNGKYDNAYLLRYGSPAFNWCGDTINMFHSWYSELPKSLDFITCYMLRKWQYWKDESKTSNLMEYYQYNAKDAFVTAMCWLALLNEVPPWATENYLKEFPLVFPCLTAELTGFKRDAVEAAKLLTQVDTVMDRELGKIKKMVGNPFYNPSSPQQTVRLFAALGSGDISNTTPASRDKVSARHPLNKKLIASITTYRKERKLMTSYCREVDPKTKKSKVWHGRIFYAINPHGTDTARLASKTSHFWCGLQIHNIPRDRKDIQIKSMFIADTGFYIGEADYEQNEARGTAHLSGDEKLIDAVQDETKDFHSKNASDFFGLAYETICSSTLTEEGKWIHKRLLIEIIDIAKRINHGANYNMGPAVMLDTMGIENVLKAKALLKLPQHYKLLQVTKYLLDKYAEKYSVVKGAWYDKCKADVMGSRFLIGPTGWHRYCFSDPTKSKHAFNSYVAHPPQSLAAMILNKAYLRVFHEVWQEHNVNFKLGPQIHDSIVFQYRIGFADLAYKVKRCMEITTPVTDTFGVTRNLFVPVALKGEAARWSELKAMR